MTKERMDQLENMVSRIIIDMDDLWWHSAQGEGAYYDRVDEIAHFIVYSLIGEMSEKKEI